MENETFETAMERLETVVKRLESGDETLDAALTDFETATALIKYCNEQLTQAEKKIELVTGEGADI